APEGYFYAAQDADSFQTASAAEPEEGAFYVWQYDELQSILSEPELSELTTEFTVTDGGNFEGQNVLQRQTDGTLSQTVVAALERLFEVRYGVSRSALETCTPAADNETACNTTWPGRIPPVTDTKMIVAWNSLVISGLARAAVAFQEPEYYAIATQAAQFMLDHQWIAGRLYRLNYNGQTAVLAQAEDYALLIKALLDLQQACLIVGGDSDGELVTNWQAIATKVQAEFDQHLWADDLGGYYTAAHDAGRDLLVRERHYADNATPAANSVAASNLVRLALLTENTDYLGRAEQTVQAFSQTMHQTPQACPGLFAALDWLQTHTLVKTKQTQIEQLAQQYWPTLVYRPELTLPAGAIGIVCRGLACREPAQSQKQLQEQLGNSMQLAANGS
ncbi:MAG: thioredoxin domain-containing protein, partial [Cyanobacteria bacterium P01_H01_bin.121]